MLRQASLLASFPSVGIQASGTLRPALAIRTVALAGFRIRERQAESPPRLDRRFHLCRNCGPRCVRQLAAHVGEHHRRFADGDRLASGLGFAGCPEGLLDCPHGCRGSRAVASAPGPLRPFDGRDPRAGRAWGEIAVPCRLSGADGCALFRPAGLALSGHARPLCAIRVCSKRGVSNVERV